MKQSNIADGTIKILWGLLKKGDAICRLVGNMDPATMVTPEDISLMIKSHRCGT
ncbi:MAG: hypothetical protein QGH15_20990 [Kiritimatiellia bacterium]|jgi:hypothetical protein|nr:hypothetical protein [Kiritimatiellia bacterium]